MSNTLASLSVAQLKKAVAIKERIGKLERKLAGILGNPGATRVGSMVRRRRGMSAATRAKMSAAAKLRWAKINAGKNPAAKPAGAKRKMSVEGRRRISEAAKARWARQKAAKK